MKFRKTTIQDINNVMQHNEAKEYFRKSKRSMAKWISKQ